MNFLMVISIGRKLKNQLSTKSLKKNFINQNKQLFGEEIYLNKLSFANNKKKVNIHDSWYYQLIDEFEKKYWIDLIVKVKNSYRKKIIYPKPSLIFNAFNSTHFNDVKVVIIGQDPYHGQDQANGLSFSVNEGITVPPSLLNIFKELESDLNIPISKSGNLQYWANQGVLLLNTVLTVEKDNANSHKNLGWEIFTRKAIEIVSSKLENIVFILWGKQAHSIQDIIDKSKHHIISSVHPSPLSANKGFFGSNPFSKTNKFLVSKGLKPIDWKLN